MFASAFLIHDEDATGLNAREISERFCVSLEAAEICFERLIEKAERARSAERVMKINAEVKATLLGNERSRSRYLDEICVICKQQTLVPNGAKVSCETCGFNGDRFQDGDKLA